MFLPAVRANALAPTEELRSLREYVRVLEDKIRVYEERDKKRQREDTAEEANNKKQLSYAQEINIRDP